MPGEMRGLGYGRYIKADTAAYSLTRLTTVDSNSSRKVAFGGNGVGGLSISVVMPVYNAEKYLRQAIRSALEQTLPPHEIIVINDGSTDSSLEIARSFGSAITCISQQNRGLSASRNLAIARSTGDWIAFLDADDYWLPEKLARQAAMIQADPSIGLIYTGKTDLSLDGTTRDVQARPPQWVTNMLPVQNYIFPTTVLTRRSLLLEHAFDESLESSEEWWLFYSLSRITKFAAIAEPTAVYRVYPESLSNRNWKAVFDYASIVAGRIQNDFTGFDKILLRCKTNSRIFANASLSQREQGSPEFLRYIVKSLILWPFPNFWPARYKILLKMLIQKSRGWRAT
ncbi:MAG: glycosyltransferase family A protein [Terracidiphilus sp.]